MRLLYITLFASSLVFTFCNTPEKQDEKYTETALPPEERAEKILQDEVIKIHDQVMPKMDELMRLKGLLHIKLDSLEKFKAEDNKITSLQEDIDQLRKAHSAMMNWMRQFKAERDTTLHEQRLNYLTKEKQRIEKVQQMMNRAIEDARTELKSH